MNTLAQGPVPRPVRWIITADFDVLGGWRFIEERRLHDNPFFVVKTWQGAYLKRDGEWTDTLLPRTDDAAQFSSFDEAYAAWRLVEGAALGAVG